jgi:hypothetical protein
VIGRYGVGVGQWDLDSQASTAAPFGPPSPKPQTQPALVTFDWLFCIARCLLSQLMWARTLLGWWW